MNKLARISAILSAFLLLSSLSAGVQAEEACGDGGNGSKDIESLVASFDAGDITVAMDLCAATDNQTKYRVHFDHTVPFAPDMDRNGDGFSTPEDACFPTDDDGMMHRTKKDTGPGMIDVVGSQLTYTVHMSELNPDLVIGDTILLWADTQHKGIKDRAPNTNAIDGCDKPEVAGEYIELELSDEITYAIGETGPAGGIVFHVTDGGLHGLEAAPGDQGNAKWGCFGTNLTGADGTAVGIGAQNTADILVGCTETGIAAKLADDFDLNGVTDWFLPSKDELNLLFDQKGVVGGFANDIYWSSSEVGSFSAWDQFFTNGDQNIDGKDNTLRVRAVRAF